MATITATEVAIEIEQLEDDWNNWTVVFRFTVGQNVITHRVTNPEEHTCIEWEHFALGRHGFTNGEGNGILPRGSTYLFEAVNVSISKKVLEVPMLDVTRQARQRGLRFSEELVE